MEKTIETKTEATIYEKLMYIQQNMKCGKGKRNEFGGFNYRNAEMILEAAKPVLSAIGCVILLNDELVYIGERYYVKAEAKLVDIKTGDSLACYAYAREEKDRKGMDASQITGSSSSYARKYALGGLLAIDDGKDADSMDNRHIGTVEAPDEGLLKECAAMDIEEEKDQIRAIVSDMSEADPDLKRYQEVLYSVLGESYGSFKVKDCDDKKVIDSILAILKKNK